MSMSLCFCLGHRQTDRQTGAERETGREVGKVPERKRERKGQLEGTRYVILFFKISMVYLTETIYPTC